MRLLAIRGDERPALAVGAVIGAGLATFLVAVLLLGGTGIANPGTEAVWTRQLRESNSRSAARTPPPALTTGDDVLLVQSGAGLSAIAPDGAVRWTRDVPIDDRLYFPGHGLGLEVVDGALVVPHDNEVSVRDLSNGETIWSEPHDSVVQALAVDGDTVHVATHGPVGRGALLTARELDTGATRWERDLAEGDLQSIAAAAADGLVFVAVQRVDIDPETGEFSPIGGEVVALDAATGEERWRTEVDAANGLAGGSPLVVEGMGALVGLDPANGETLWEWSDPRGAAHGTVVADGRVATVLDTSTDGIVDVGDPTQIPVVLDAADGSEIWRGEPEFNFTFQLAGDHLVLAASHGPVTSFGAIGEDADLLVRELPSGNVAWQRNYRTETPWTPLGLAAREDTLFVSESNGAVHALDPSSGDVAWSVGAGPSPDDDGPLVGADAVFLLGEDGAIRSLSLTDGEERWSTLHSVRGASPPAISERHVYAATGLGIVRAYDRGSGEVVWETERRHGLVEDGAPRPAVTAGTVAVADPDGTLVALDTGDGTQRWTVPAADVLATTGHEEHVIVAYTDGRVVAHDDGDGAERWSTEVAAPLRWGPIVVGTGLAVATTDGEVVLLEAADGTVRWRHDSGDPELPLAAVDASSLYLRTGEQVVALDAATGERSWMTTASGTGSFVGTAAVGGGQVFIATSDLAVVVLSPTTGEEVDRIDVAAPIRWLRASADGLAVVMTTDAELRAYR